MSKTYGTTTREMTTAEMIEALKAVTAAYVALPIGHNPEGAAIRENMRTLSEILANRAEGPNVAGPVKIQ